MELGILYLSLLISLQGGWGVGRFAVLTLLFRKGKVSSWTVVPRSKVSAKGKQQIIRLIFHLWVNRLATANELNVVGCIWAWTRDKKTCSNRLSDMTCYAAKHWKFVAPKVKLFICFWSARSAHLLFFSVFSNISPPSNTLIRFNFWSKDRLTKKKDRILIKDLIGNKWKI